MNKKIFFVAIFSLLLDQVTKVIASIFLNLNQPLKVINNFFYLTLCHNEGAAWGLFSNAKYIIMIGTVVALLLIYHFYYCFKNNTRNNIAFGLLMGGLTGNLLDRLTLGYVRDFFDFFIIKYDFPVFNFADVSIVIGVILLIYAILKGEDQSGNNSNNKQPRKTRQVSSK